MSAESPGALLRPIRDGSPASPAARPWVALLGPALAFGVSIRLAAAPSAAIWFDEATVGLMGRNVLKGEFPWFFYGQTFMGAAEAFLHALAFALFGSSLTVLRLWPVVTSLVHIALVGLLAQRIFHDARWAVLVALVPSAFLLKWGHDARLHYDLILVLTPLLLLLGLGALDAAATAARRTRALLVFGFVAGLGWWINLLHGIPLAAFAPVLLLRRPRFHRAAGGLPVALLVGSLPFWLFSLARDHLAASRAPLASGREVGEHAWHLAANALPIVMGVPEPFPPGIAKSLLSAGAVALFVLAAAAALSDRRSDANGRLLLAALLAISVLAVLGTEHGRNLATEDPRYLLPLLAVVPVLLGGLMARLARGTLAGAAAGTLLVLGLHAAGLRVEYPFLFSWSRWLARQTEISGPTQRVAFLSARGLDALYTHDPDVLTFASGERASVSHFYLESYPPLARRVDAATRVVYFSGDPPPGFEGSLAAAGIRYQREQSPLGWLYSEFALEHPAYREIAAVGWTGAAAPNAERATHAIDRDVSTRWDSGGGRRSGMWFQVDLGRLHRVGMVAWLPAGFQEVPVGFRLEASEDGVRWTSLREVAPYYGPLYWADGHPIGRIRWGRVEVRFPTIWARHLRITHLGEDRRFAWSIREFFAYEASAPHGDPPPEARGAAAALVRAGIHKVYADHGVGARLAEASRGRLAIEPSNIRIDPYGTSPNPDFLPLFRALPDVALVYPPTLPSAESIETTLERAGWTFSATEAGGYRVLSRFTRREVAGAPLTPRDWTLTGSPQIADPRAVLDGLPETRWTTGGPQSPGAWLQVDLGAPTRLTGLSLELGGFPSDYPRGLALERSEDGVRWAPVRIDPVLIGPLRWAGTHLLRDGVDRVLVQFEPVRARTIRVIQTGRDPVFDWSVTGLTLFGS